MDFLKKKIDKDSAIKLFLLSMWLLFCGYLVLSLIKPLYQDEGVFLTIGRGLAQGKIPYLDFWDHKTPGIYYLWASLFYIFGTNIILYKLFIWVVNFVIAYLVFDTSEKLKPSSGKYALIFFLTSLTFLEGNYLIAGQFLGLFLMIATWLLLAKRDKYWSYLGCGAALAMAIIFKQTAIFNVLPLLIFVISTLNYRYVLLFLSGFLSLLFANGEYLQGLGAYQEFWNQAFVASSKSYPPEPIDQVLGVWRETFQRFWWVWFGLVLSFGKNGIAKRGFWLLVFMSSLPIYSFYVRHYPHYWLQVIPFIAVLAGIGFYNFVEKFANSKYMWLIFTTFFVIIISYGANLLWYKWITDNMNSQKEKEQTQVTQLLKDLPEKRILAENRFTGFNFLSDKEPLTKYLYLTEVNEGENARQKTLDALRSSNDFVAVWPIDQKYVYAKEIGDWLVSNSTMVEEYPALDLAVYEAKK